MYNRVSWTGLILVLFVAALFPSSGLAAKPVKSPDAVIVSGEGAGIAPAAPDTVRASVIEASDPTLASPNGPVCDGFAPSSTDSFSGEESPSPDCGGYIPPPPPPPTCCTAPAPTPVQPVPINWIGCATWWAYRGLNHVLGYSLYKYYVQKRWCSNGYGIYEDNTWRWVEVNYGWKFDGHLGDTQTTGNETRSYFTQGSFSTPATPWVVRYPWLQVCYGIYNGTLTICGSGG